MCIRDRDSMYCVQIPGCSTCDSMYVAEVVRVQTETDSCCYDITLVNNYDPLLMDGIDVCVLTTGSSMTVDNELGSYCLLYTSTAPVQPTITQIGILCPSVSAVLDAGTGPGFVSYLWSNAMTTQTISISGAGVYTVTTTDGNGCTAVDSYEAFNVPGPVASISTADPLTLCIMPPSPGTVTLYAQTNPNYTCLLYTSTGSSFTDLQILNNALDGIAAGNNNIASYVVAGNNGFDGIDFGESAAIYHCTAANNLNDGIEADAGSSLLHCTARDNSQHGFRTTGPTTISLCNATENNNHGFSCGAGSTVSQNAASNNTLDGFYLFSATMLSLIHI